MTNDQALQPPTGALRALRFRMRRYPRLRSAYYFALETRKAVWKSADRTRDESLDIWRGDPDPWGYETPWGGAYFEAIESLLDVAGAEASTARAIDVGCGEGWMVQRLAGRYDEVVGVEISDLALERARERCADAENVRFQRWDVLRDAPPAQFDLAVAMGVVEMFNRPRPLRGLRRGLIGLLGPGGHLLVTTTKQSPVIEGARWSGLLVRGASGVDHFLRATGELELCGRREIDTHVHSLYRAAR
jgi:2-polyprenyl-3-methyl-5-hydroxy-6-metoxy-1,4-benzoquinol methylase